MLFQKLDTRFNGITLECDAETNIFLNRAILNRLCCTLILPIQIASNRICIQSHFFYSAMLYSFGWVVEGSHNIVISVDKQLLFVGKNDLASTILWQKNGVSDLDHCFTDSSVLKCFSWSNGEDDTLVEFLFLSRCEKDFINTLFPIFTFIPITTNGSIITFFPILVSFEK